MENSRPDYEKLWETTSLEMTVNLYKSVSRAHNIHLENEIAHVGWTCRF